MLKQLALPKIYPKELKDYSDINDIKTEPETGLINAREESSHFK